jgi:hypothetical protein
MTMKKAMTVASFFLALAAMAACPGCVKKYVNKEYGVERYITVRSDPPGAHVFIDNEEVGDTPIENYKFIHYGTRRITIMAPGYKTISTYERIGAPIYQWFPVDFVFELLLPVKLEDHHNFLYILEPDPEMDVQEFIRKAQEFRQKERQSP